MRGLLSISCFVLLTGLTAAAQSDTSFKFLQAIPGDFQEFTVDNLDNIYTLNSRNQVKRWSASGDSIAIYNEVKNFGKAGFILGAEHGKGIVYEKGKPIGEARVTEINVDPQVGGESFYEILFFETAEALAGCEEDYFEMVRQGECSSGSGGCRAEREVSARRDGVHDAAKRTDGTSCHRRTKLQIQTVQRITLAGALAFLS